jgi:hypothetical protein
MPNINLTENFVLFSAAVSNIKSARRHFRFEDVIAKLNVRRVNQQEIATRLIPQENRSGN